MPAWLLPAALGLLSAGGTVATNRANQRSADKQMEFQERLSSTAAQRAVKDYEAAGLNPALAYDRPAATGGGASATLGDPASSGISNAREAVALRQQMQLARESTAADIELKRSQAAESRKRGQLVEAQQFFTDAQTRASIRDNNFQTILQPFQLRLNAAQALLNEYQLTGAKNEAALNSKMGILRPILGDVFTGVRGLSPLFPGRR